MEAQREQFQFEIDMLGERTRELDREKEGSVCTGADTKEE